MKKTVHKYLIPHQGNNYKPKLFDYSTLAVILMLGVGLFLSGFFVNKFVRTTDLGASVYASVLVDLTNDVRKDNARPLLALNDKLTQAAQMKADDMAQKHYFAHTSPTGITPWFWFQQASYPFAFAGENLAVDFTESKNVEDAWLASPTHRENILDARFTEIGIATAEGYLEGKSTTFVVQMFGTPTLPLSPSKNMLTATPTSSSEENSVRVLGATAPEPNVAVITETPTTIVVQNESISAATVSAVESNEKYAGMGASLLVKSPMYIRYGLLALAVLVFVSIVLLIFVEIKRQHPWRIFLGCLLLVIILYFAYVSKSYYLLSDIG
jgi:hypothetical protein